MATSADPTSQGHMITRAASAAAGAAADKAGASGGKRGPGQGAAAETGAGGGKKGPATRQDTAPKAGAGGGKKAGAGGDDGGKKDPTPTATSKLSAVAAAIRQSTTTKAGPKTGTVSPILINVYFFYEFILSHL